jgi:hypothetical protein
MRFNEIEQQHVLRRMSQVSVWDRAQSGPSSIDRTNTRAADGRFVLPMLFSRLSHSAVDPLGSWSLSRTMPNCFYVG